MQGSISTIQNFTYSHELQRTQNMCISHIKLFIEASLLRDIFDIRARQKENTIEHTRIMMPKAFVKKNKMQPTCLELIKKSCFVP